MSELARAQASVIAELVRSPPPEEHVHGGLNLALTGLHSPATLRRGFAYEGAAAGAAGAGASAAASAGATAAALPASASGRDHSSDFSALLMEDWIDEYMRERHSFDSVSLFCEIKLKELIELTNSLNVGLSDDPTAAAGGQTPRSVPSKVRTAVCIDLLDILIGSVIHPDRATAGAGGSGTLARAGLAPPPITAAPGAAHSRQALGRLLLKLRDELVKSIYVQPLPPHLLLQFQPDYQTHQRKTQPLAPSSSSTSGSPGPSFQRRKHTTQLGSLTARTTASQRKFNEEKQEDAATAAPGSLSHRARLLSSPRHSYPTLPSLGSTSGAAPFSAGPPSSLSSLLRCTEWFSLIGPAVARNQQLAERARIVMIPSKLFRLRQIQKKVVAGMTDKWRDLLLRWKFWEWKETTAQRKRDREASRSSRLATRITDRLALLHQKLALQSWRQLIVLRKYGAMRALQVRGSATNRELVEETARLAEETLSVRTEIARLESGNANLQHELRVLKAKLEHSQVDLQDTSKHQQQCSELLDALRGPLSFVFGAVGAQLDSFAARDYSSVHPLLTLVVDSEYQMALEPLAIPAAHGVEHWALSIAQGNQKQRVAVCAQIVARWLALQLRLAAQVLSGGAGSYSEYLVKPDNQQRLAAALARIRQLTSANPPTVLPPFPAPPLRRRIGAPSGTTTTTMTAATPQQPATSGTLAALGSLPPGRSRARASMSPPSSSASLSVVVSGDGADKNGADEGDEHEGAGGGGGSNSAAPSPRPRARGAMPGGGGGASRRKTVTKDDLPAASAGDAAKMRRLAEARGYAIPTGTLSTPQRVFGQLRDSDRPESVLAVSSMLMHADGEVARSLRLPPERRWTRDEKENVAALRALMDSLRVTPEMRVSEMDAALRTAQAGLDSSAAAIARARSAQARLHAVEDEVFAQSVRLLHQQSQRKHRHGERENNMPTDLLDLDLSLYTDVFETPPTKSDVTETNRIVEEYCRDLYKIFAYYCQSGAAGTAASLLNSAGTTAQTEPRMANAEFWRFVRDCKLKVQQTALIDQVYVLVASRSSAIAPELAESLHKLAVEGKIPTTDPTAAAAAVHGSAAAGAGAGGIGGVTGLSGSGPAAAAQLLSAAADSGLSLSESEAVAEAARVSQLRDLGFRQFGEALVRLALIKFSNEKLLHRKVKNLLLGHVLPHASQRAMAWSRQQVAAAANAAAAQGGAAATVAAAAHAAAVVGPGSSSSGGVVGGAVGLALGPGGVAANLSTVEVDAVFRKYNTLLRQVFQIYARITPQFMTMTFNDFLGFAREFELLHKYVTQHDLKQLFTQCIKDVGAGSSSEAAAAAEAAGGAAAGAAALAAVDRSKRTTQSSLTGGSGGGGGVLGGPGGSLGGGGGDDDDDGSGGQPSRELSYRQFLELLAAVSHYVIRNPYFSLHDRVDKFIVSVLASRKKLPAKVYRSAV